MGRKANDGRGRLGGRTKGTPNRPQEPLSIWVSGIVDKHRTDIEKALAGPWTPEASNLLAALMITGALNNITPGPRTLE